MNPNRAWEHSNTPMMNIPNLSSNLDAYGEGKAPSQLNIGGQSIITQHGMNGVMNINDNSRLPPTNFYPSHMRYGCFVLLCITLALNAHSFNCILHIHQ